MGKPGRLMGSRGRIWLDSDGAPWTVVVTWAEVGGRAEPVGIQVVSFTDVANGEAVPFDGHDLRPVKTSVLRGDLMSAVESDRQMAIEHRREHVQTADWFGRTFPGEDLGADVVAELEGVTRELGAYTAGRARKLVNAEGETLAPDEALAEVASIYMAAWRARENPTKAVADRLSLSRSAAAKRVARARAGGLLPATTKGRATGRES